MNTPNDGGPAFPWLKTKGNQKNIGMSQHDLYVAFAMAGDCANGIIPDDASDTYLARRAKAYHRLADAVLKAREQ